ncbi:MAG: hypothetical protein MUC88_00310 [Planctomycetes bacterium]|jgi:hypothetical protein|nr:hypothetical protein [Planctomycetota bacterium]
MNYSEQLKLCRDLHNFTSINYDDPDNLLPIRKAAKMKCMDCCSGDTKMAQECGVKTCALYPYRAGRNPNPPRMRTEIQIAADRAAGDRLRRARASRSL